MKKTILSLSLTALAILSFNQKAFAKDYETRAIESEAMRGKGRNFVESVEQKAHEASQKSKEVIHNVKQSIEHKNYELHLKSAQRAKAKAEKRAHILEKKAEATAKQAQDASQRAKHIAKYIEIEQKARDYQAKSDYNPHYNEEVLQKNYEHYLKAAQVAKEKAEQESLEFQQKSKEAAHLAKEAAHSADEMAKHIETEQKVHDLHERFKEVVGELDNKN